LNTARRIGARIFGLLIKMTFIRTSPYLLQQIIPRTITTIARIRVIQTVGRQQATTQPPPKAIHKNSLLHIFFIANTSFVAFTISYSNLD
jgi:hypothetical protein